MTDVATTPDKTTTVTATPAAVVSTTTTKSSVWSTEHVLAYVALVLTAGYSTGLIPTDGLAAKIAACAAAVLISLGYTVGRSMVKAAVIMCLVLACSAPTLTACKGPAPVPVSDLIDCVKQEGTANWAQVVAQLTPDLGDWSKLVTDVEALGPKWGFDIVRCVGEELIAQYLSVKHADTASTWSAHDAAEKIRAAASAPGRSVTFKTSHGNL